LEEIGPNPIHRPTVNQTLLIINVIAFAPALQERRKTKTMVNVSYENVMQVTISWDKLKQIDNFQDRVGELVLHRLLELEPNARALFKFERNEDLRKNARVMVHARAVFDMVDMAVSLLGPDLDPLADELVDLGQRHIAYGVSKEYLPVMENAVLYALEELLDSKFSKADRYSWQVVFRFIISNRMEGMK
jgi:hemoglobin-like flavoprotein